MKSAHQGNQEQVSERVEQKRQHRKMEILTSASKLYARYGYHGTTLEAIAAELGMTRAALYRYMTSKDELLCQCHEVAYERFLKALEQLRSLKDPKERLESMLKAHILLFLRDFPAFGSVLLSVRFLPIEYRERIHALRKKVESLYLSCIQDWRQQSPDTLIDLDDTLVLNVLLSSVNSVVRWWKGDRNPQIVANEVVFILMNGIHKA